MGLIVSASALLVCACHQLVGVTDTHVTVPSTSTTGGSSASPAAIPCGDGVIQADERCDDGNRLSGDGCSSQCQVEPRLIALGGQQSCVIGFNGVVKCWGDNKFGELGISGDSTRGDESGEMGPNLAAPERLNLQRPMQWIATGYRHTCAASDDGVVYCWGGSGVDMNASDRFASIPFDRGVKAILAGQYHTCVLLLDHQLKCWGQNYYGQLGLGAAGDRDPLVSAGPTELPSVVLGTGRQVIAMALGGLHTCVILDNGLVKCWGDNEYGQLGLGDMAIRGLSQLTMGDALPYVDLGTGRTAKVIAAGQWHTCAVLDDDSLKCWGRNHCGQLGLGDQDARGNGSKPMGDELPAVALGSSKVLALALGEGHSCALLENHRVKCWGKNDYVELGLGLGDSEQRWDPGGDDPERYVNLGTEQEAIAISAGRWHTCAMLRDNRVKCWGWNGDGQLGLGDKIPRGSTIDQMGDNLPAVDLVF